MLNLQLSYSIYLNKAFMKVWSIREVKYSCTE